MKSLHETSRESWRTHYLFLPLFYFNVFSSCMCYALVLPAIWNYLEDTQSQDNLVAYILASFSVGEVIGAILFGCLTDKYSTKSTLLLCLFIGLLGTLLSLLASLSDLNLKMTGIFIGRFLQGMWNGGEQAVEQAYISEVVSDVSKLRALSEIGIAGVCGYIFGPVVGVIVSIVDRHLYEELQLDVYTLPGILQLLIIIIMISVTFCKFKEISIPMRVNRMSDPDSYERPNKIGVIACLFVCFVLFNGFTVQETITGPLVTDNTQVIIYLDIHYRF